MRGEYTLASTAWVRHVWALGPDEYAEDVLQVTLDEEGGSVKFTWLSEIGVRVTAFNDSWKALLVIAPVLEKLSGRANITPLHVIVELAAHGFKSSRYHGQLSK